MDFRFYSISIKGFFNKTYLIDENQLPAYEIVKTNWFTKVYKMVDSDLQDILTIQADFKLLGVKYTILKNQKVYATVEKETFDSTYHVTTAADMYSIEKRLMEKGVTFLNGIEEVAKMSYNLSRKKDKVKIAIDDQEDQELILALAFIMLLRLLAKKKRKKRKKKK